MLAHPVTISAPGTPIAMFITPPSTVLAQDDLTAGPVAVGSAVRLDSSPSAFADTIAWTVSACTGTPANPGLCDTSLPVVGSTNTVAWFPLGAAGTYKLTLTLDGGKEPLATATPYYYQVQ